MVASQKIVGCFAVTHDVNWALISIETRMHACGAGLIITVHYRVVRTKTVIQSSSVGWAASFRVGFINTDLPVRECGAHYQTTRRHITHVCALGGLFNLENASFEQAGCLSGQIGTAFLNPTNLGLDCNKTIRRTPKDSNFGCSPDSASQIFNCN